MMKLKYLGHSCFQVDVNGKTLLIDPFITANPLAESIDIEALRPDYVLLTHGHEDHILDAERILQNSNATLICSYEAMGWYAKKGITNFRPMGIGGKAILDFGSVRCVSAIHSSAMPDGSYGGTAMGFVIESNEGNIYIAGDTALTLDMKLIPELCAPLDRAILPIGDNFTMGPEDAIRAAQFVKCSKVIACHFDTFDIIKIDHQRTQDLFRLASIDLHIPSVGESIDI